MFINLRESEDRKIYVVSDTHWHHNPLNWTVPLWKARGYSSVEEHDIDIETQINARVRPNDILIHLGDICLNTTKEQLDGFLDRIQCKNIYALWGNHNNPHEKKIFYAGQTGGNVRGFKTVTYPFEYKNLVFFPHYVEAVLNGHYTVLCHYPIHIWNEMAHGAWMLCGHSHGGCEFSVPENSEGKILDCGWDLHKKPLSIAEIDAIMATKNFHALDKHHTPEGQKR